MSTLERLSMDHDDLLTQLIRQDRKSIQLGT